MIPFRNSYATNSHPEMSFTEIFNLADSKLAHPGMVLYASAKKVSLKSILAFYGERELVFENVLQVGAIFFNK